MFKALKTEYLYKKGKKLEGQEKLEEAFECYEKSAAKKHTGAMIAISYLYLSGKFRPVTTTNLSEALFGGGPIFPWSIRKETKPDYESGITWLQKAAELDNGKACSILGNMLASGVGCKADVQKGLKYLEKAAKLGVESAKNDIRIYRPDGKALSDEEYEKSLADFAEAADKGDPKAAFLYSTLKSGTDKQLARLGYVLMASQNINRGWDERFKPAYLPSGIPLFPAAAKRGAWKTFVRFDLNAFRDKYPLILVSSDILNVDQPGYLLDCLHRAEIVGKAKYLSPEFGWLNKEKKAVVIRLGTDNPLNDRDLDCVAKDFYLIRDEYEPGNVSFFVENGEKEYSFEIAGVNGDQVDVLWRYTIGGSSKVDEYFEPELKELNLNR